MEKSKSFNGVPVELVQYYSVPDDLAKEANFNITSAIVPIVDVESLIDYNYEEIGEYYKSRSELVAGFYKACSGSDPQVAEPSVLVPYKEDGDAEFIFEHFILSSDKKTIYAVYAFNTTIS